MVVVVWAWQPLAQPHNFLQTATTYTHFSQAHSYTETPVFLLLPQCLQHQLVLSSYPFSQTLCRLQVLILSSDFPGNIIWTAMLECSTVQGFLLTLASLVVQLIKACAGLPFNQPVLLEHSTTKTGGPEKYQYWNVFSPPVRKQLKSSTDLLLTAPAKINAPTHVKLLPPVLGTVHVVYCISQNNLRLLRCTAATRSWFYIYPLILNVVYFT